MGTAPLLEATEHQGRARIALSAALAAQPSHAYLFRGPRGSGKRAAAGGDDAMEPSLPGPRGRAPDRAEGGVDAAGFAEAGRADRDR